VRRPTHLALGVAAAAPVAVVADPPLAGAVGCLWLGAMGGALPDYLDLRSGARRALRHRGVSHSLAVAFAAGGFVWLVLDALARGQSDLFRLSAGLVGPWSTAFAAGHLSHLMGDALTRGGIQPLLPLSPVRFWLAPRWLRGRSDGRVNAVAFALAIVVIGACSFAYLSR
jgi:membrane-bound metal-dependent hydrolase YbcI (DUF457 family)